MQYVVETTPAESRRITFQYPISDSWLINTLCSTIQEVKRKGKNPRLAIFDTVVSMPGVRMPFEKLVGLCKDEGVLSLVDGAHGVGMLGSELDLGKLEADFFVTNCHKYVCSPLLTPVYNICQIEEPGYDIDNQIDGSSSPAAALSSTFPRAINTSSALPSQPHTVSCLCPLPVPRLSRTPCPRATNPPL